MLGLCRYYASPRAAGAAHRILLRSAPPPIFTIAARIRVARAARAGPVSRYAYDPSAQFSFRAPTSRAVPASGIPHTPVTGPALKAFARRSMITITSRPRAHANREMYMCDP